MKFSRSAVRLVGALSVGALALAACGGSSHSTTAGSVTSSASATPAAAKACGGKLTHLTVAGVGVYTDAIIPLGTAKGFFAQHCLTVTRTEVANPAASIADLVGGSVDVAYAPSIPLVKALSGGAPLLALAPADGEPSAAGIASAGYKADNDLTGIYVPANSKLTTASELQGQTVSVPARSAQLEVVAAWDIKKLGGNPTKVNWIVLDFPTAVAELDAGKLTAAGLTLPFSNEALAHGDRLLDGSDVSFFGVGSPVGIWTTSKAKMASERTALLEYRAAVLETNAYADSHLSQLFPYAAQITQIPLATVKVDPAADYFPTTLTEANLARVASNMVYAGYLSSAPDLAGVVVP